MVIRYQKRVSGPIIDRIDLHASVPAVSVEKLTGSGLKAESSDVIQKRVQKARDVQLRRFAKIGAKSNAEMTVKAVKELCDLTADVRAFLGQAVARMGLSARSYYRVIKIARTIGDLNGAKDLELSHVAEALQYRPKEDT